MLLVVSISDHLARTASPGRTYVNNCHSISIRVSNRIEAFVKDSINLGNSLGGRVGIFCFFGLLKLWPRLSAGLNSISSSVAAHRKISFRREMMRRRVSNTPRCSIGSRCCFKILGRISLIGTLPRLGKTFLSKLRQISAAWSCEIPDVFTFSSNHFRATAWRVCSVALFHAFALSLL